jgi:hypothetical protein
VIVFITIASDFSYGFDKLKKSVFTIVADSLTMDILDDEELFTAHGLERP